MSPTKTCEPHGWHPVEVCAVQDSRGLIVITYSFPLRSPISRSSLWHIQSEGQDLRCSEKGPCLCQLLCRWSLPSAAGKWADRKEGYVQSIIVSSSGGLFWVLLLHNSVVRQRKRTYRQEECLIVRLSNSSAGVFMKCLPKWPSVPCRSVNLPVEMFSLPRSLWDVFVLPRTSSQCLRQRILHRCGCLYVRKRKGGRRAAQ